MNNKYQTVYTASFVCSVIAIIVLPCTSMMLLHEYYNLAGSVTALQNTKEQYRHYINFCARTGLNSFEREIADSLVTQVYSFETATETEEDLNFLVLNRNPLYLSQSASSFAHTVSNMSVHDLQDLAFAYTEDIPFKTLTSAALKKGIPKKSVLKKTIVRKQSNFMWPIDLNSFWLSSPYGPRKNKRNGRLGFHYGIDLAAAKRTIVRAAAGGVVVKATYSGGYGNVVEIQHTKQLKTRYAHLDSILVRVGQKVSTQTIIGRVGETGHVLKKTKDGSHLHFEICNGEKRVNPIAYLPIIKTIKL